MSLGVVIKGPEGVVLAADSRLTLEAQNPQRSMVIPVTFDNASKLLTFGSSDSGLNDFHRHVAAVTYGQAVIGTELNDLRTAHSFVPELVGKLGEVRLTTARYAEVISEFFMDQWKNKMPADYKGGAMTFVVGGIDEGEAYGKTFLFTIPFEPKPVEQSKDEFGITWGGQVEYATRLIYGHDPKLLSAIENSLNLDSTALALVQEAIRPFRMPVPYSILPLQDCIDYATFLIDLTTKAQSLGIGLRGVGGPIDVVTITRTEGLRFIQQKALHGTS
ncbi:MAG: hypothetical protein BZY87_04220 [SAR202 cluster bacterium Io17-Chloro-G6]|nr:MAG: hypothetical protein BZY87_04220 [SAR202 cluster bacterium Io17-Chloro-G6]